MEEGTPPPCQISPHRCNVSPLRGEKPQNWPLSKLNTGRFALRAMLPDVPVIITSEKKSYILTSVHTIQCRTQRTESRQKKYIQKEYKKCSKNTYLKAS